MEHFADQIANGSTIALISDAGTPGISDPGFLLVRECVKNGTLIEALPGPTAFVPALVASGLPCDKFYFEGFLPHKKGRKTRMEFLAALPCTSVLYESPHRIVKTLEQLQEHFGADHQACVARELTKTFEEIKNGSIDELRDYFTAHPPRGEITVLIAPPREAAVDGAQLDAMLRDAMTSMSRRDAVQAVAEMTGQPRRAVYARALTIDDGPRDASDNGEKEEEKNAAHTVEKEN